MYLLREDAAFTGRYRDASLSQVFHVNKQQLQTGDRDLTVNPAMLEGL